MTARVSHPLLGNKIAFPHSHLARIDTGLSVEVDPGYRLCFRLTGRLADRGMVAVNAPGRFSSGPVSVVLLNCGKEVVEVRDGDEVAELWLEPEVPFDWSE